MKYYIDTEFLEGTQSKKLLGITYGQTKPTIDLISIGIVAEDGREYYAVSKEFNLEEAWNRWQYNENNVSGKNQQGKEYWIRENVLRPIWEELSFRYIEDRRFPDDNSLFTCKSLKNLLDKYGKTNKQIAEEIKEFCDDNKTTRAFHLEQSLRSDSNKDFRKIEFYGYYADYDWVVFCWLFGNMIDLPDGFPQYCIDLKQELDRIEAVQKEKQIFFLPLKEYEKYPKQTNEHSAIHDARWNKQLHEFINKI
jgi:hypothetical protein